MRYLFLLLVLFSNAFTSFGSDDPSKIADQTHLSITVTETVDVADNLLQAVLKIEQDGENAKDVQNLINENMTKAVALTKQYPAIKVSTDQYYVYQYDQEQKIDDKRKSLPKKMWRGNQSLSLESINSDDLLELTGKLQEAGLQVQNLSYSLSDDKRESVKNSLIEGALAKLSKKGEIIAKTLGKSYIGLTYIDIDPRNYGQQAAPILMSKAINNLAIAKPIAIPGTSQVSITINGIALLK